MYDCFVLWQENIGKSTEFKNMNNYSSNSIQLTLGFDAKDAFMDILIKIQEGKMKTDIFYKPLTSNSTFFSPHVTRNTKLRIPLNVVKRICTIVSEPSKVNKD